MITLYRGDFREFMAAAGPGPVGVVVTDPPYGISFKSGWSGACVTGDQSAGLRDEMICMLPGVPMLVFGTWKVAAPAGVKANLIWHKPGAGMGDLKFPFKPDYELIHVIGKGFAHAVRGSSVLCFKPAWFRGAGYHPHQKPVKLIQYLLERCPAGAVFDPFMGSGSVGVAAVLAGRDFIGCEIEPKYFEIAERRIKAAESEVNHGV